MRAERLVAAAVVVLAGCSDHGWEPPNKDTPPETRTLPPSVSQGGAWVIDLR